MKRMSYKFYKGGKSMCKVTFCTNDGGESGCVVVTDTKGNEHEVGTYHKHFDKKKLCGYVLELFSDKVSELFCDSMRKLAFYTLQGARVHCEIQDL